MGYPTDDAGWRRFNSGMHRNALPPLPPRPRRGEPVPGTRLMHRQIGPMLVLIGECGEVHAMQDAEGRALAEWLAARFLPPVVGVDMASGPDRTFVWPLADAADPATPAREQDSREAWRRLYHEARGVADRMQAENTRLRAELDQARADLAEAENRAPTGLEERGG